MLLTDTAYHSVIIEGFHYDGFILGTFEIRPFHGSDIVRVLKYRNIDQVSMTLTRHRKMKKFFR